MEEIIDNIKKILDTKHKKSLHFKKYMINYSGALINELSNKRSQKFYTKFKRGQIVHIDFGVNVFEEFSFPHFAIVLNKKDNGKKSILTVLPLSSKNKRGNIFLGDLFKENLYLKYFNILMSEKESLKKLRHKNKIILKKIKIARFVIAKSTKIVFFSSIFITFLLLFILKLKFPFLIIAYLLVFFLNLIFYKFLSIYTHNVQNESDKIVIEVEKMKSIQNKNEIELNKIRNAIEKLSKNDKNSYACISQITTVHKSKVQDKIYGQKIVVSSIILDKIDEALHENI